MSQSSLPALSPLFTGRWDAVVAELSRTVDLEATARQFKAIQRVKKVHSAEDLLRLAMIWGPGRQSYRETAALAAHGKIVDIRRCSTITTSSWGPWPDGIIPFGMPVIGLNVEARHHRIGDL